MKKKITEPLPEVEIPDAGEIPEGWTNVLLGDVCTHPQYGWTTSTDHNPDGLKIVRTSDISSGKIDWTIVPSCVSEPNNIEKYLLKSGDILISRAGSVGMSYKIQDCPRAVFASYLIRFRALDSIDTEYLEYFLKSRQYWESIADETIGITIPNVNASKLKNIPIPLPPLSEQQRIVARVEALLTHINAAREPLSRVPLIMKKFRQAVLAAACSGRLTDGWREENPDVETVLELFDNLKINCANLIDQETKIYNDIPLTWQNIPLEIIGNNRKNSIVDGPFGTQIKVKEDYIQNGIPVIRINNVRPFKFIPDNLKFVSESKYQDLIRHNLIPGDILLTKVGSTLGECCIFPNNFEKGLLSTTGSCRIRMREEMISNQYLCIYLNSITDYFHSIASVCVQPFLNMQTIKKIPISFPPLAEQHEIVRRVGLLFERADAFDQEVVAAGRRCERLTQAVLGKAFRGELVMAGMTEFTAI